MLGEPGEANGPAEKALADRRATVRIPVETAGSCQPIKGQKGVQWPANVYDISTRGIGVILPRRFEPDTLLTIELHGPDGEVLRRLMVRTRHLTQTDDGRWRVGCVFISRLSQSDLSQLLRQLDTPIGETATIPLAFLDRIGRITD